MTDSSSSPFLPDATLGGNLGRLESAYTLGVAEGIAAAMALLSSVRASLVRQDDQHATTAGHRDQLHNASASARSASSARTDVLSDVTDATWIAAFALALASDHAPCSDDVHDLLRMSGNDAVVLSLATTRLQAEPPDTMARRTALRLLQDAHHAADDGTVDSRLATPEPPRPGE